MNGSTANASGEVTLGPDVIQYKSGLSSIKSVAGTFTFDSNSGIVAADLPAEVANADWTGIQFGMKNGNDKTQFIFNSRTLYYRFSDTNLGSEVWDSSSWIRYDLADLAQDSAVVHKAGAETISGAKTLTGGMAVVDTMIVRDLSAVKGTNPSSACFMGIWFADKNAVPGAATTNANVLGAIEAAIRSDGTSDVKMYSNRNEAGTDDRAQIMVGWRFDSAGVLVPSTFLTNTVSMVGYETQRTYRVFRIEKDGDNADNFVISGANQTTFLCSGEIGYDDPEAAAVRAALRKSAEDVVIASDNRVVIASNCNSRDISQVKIAYLDASGYFHLPVDPVSSSNASWGRRQARTPAAIWGSVREPQDPHVVRSLRRTSTSPPLGRGGCSGSPIVDTPSMRSTRPHAQGTSPQPRRAPHGLLGSCAPCFVGRGRLGDLKAARSAGTSRAPENSLACHARDRGRRMPTAALSLGPERH